MKNVKRNFEGRYFVRLPFNVIKADYGESHSIASRRFHYLEARFVKKSEIKARIYTLQSSVGGTTLDCSSILVGDTNSYCRKTIDSYHYTTQLCRKK